MSLLTTLKSKEIAPRTCLMCIERAVTPTISAANMLEVLRAVTTNHDGNHSFAIVLCFAQSGNAEARNALYENLTFGVASQDFVGRHPAALGVCLVRGFHYRHGTQRRFGGIAWRACLGDCRNELHGL
jgi:hypothetical protein